MYRSRVGEVIDGGKTQFCYVEMDPSRRYGRLKDVLGKGAMKTVYRAFDEFLGIEVAWNQVTLDNAFRSPEELQRLFSEVHLLKNLSHDSIIRFQTSWIDVEQRNFNFITEMFTSGNLREYRQKYKGVNIQAIKNWARQIIEGLDYLHSHDPPVIHRDLKCDNIFVNGHLGQVKIGDLGLAAILHGSHHAHSVIGTPEFMAPELYEEDYDELVDIYSFGMCILEMLTTEYPYSECSNAAQIYKKVTCGKLPDAFYRVEDVEARRFIGRCLNKVADRPSARELLADPFLAIEEVEQMPITKSIKMTPISDNNLLELSGKSGSPERKTDMTITGTMNDENDTIFLKVHISDKDGHARNIYFPFDISSDTPLEVATEMVKELEISDWKPCEIADMIKEEISALIPCWEESDDSPELHQQHSFNYNEDDDESPHHPFYSPSELSSYGSLPGLFSPREASSQYGTWLPEESKVNDDSSSQTSSYYSKYSNVNYCQENEDDAPLSPPTPREEPGHVHKPTQKQTRFCPEQKMSIGCNKQCSGLLKTRSILSSDGKQNLNRTRSVVDIRSQLLHQTLVEEVNKRSLFKTVGAIEHIGYYEPAQFPGNFTRSR